METRADFLYKKPKRIEENPLGKSIEGKLVFINVNKKRIIP